MGHLNFLFHIDCSSSLLTWFGKKNQTGEIHLCDFEKVNRVGSLKYKRDSPSLPGLLPPSPQADVRESGTLTEHELSDAMRTVMGATPKAAETSRVLRFFGEPGAEGERMSE